MRYKAPWQPEVRYFAGCIMIGMLCHSAPAFGTTTVIRDIGKSLQQEGLLVWLDQQVAISMHLVLPSNALEC
jgi:hypothetical protein